jgi:PTH1 family peptidyl-tRNA hydrolase
VHLILGIGNPSDRYSKNRHNVGFIFLNHLAEKYLISFLPSKNDYYFAEKKIGENYFCLIKPANYVNNSGIAAALAIKNYNCSVSNLLVVHDDVYLSTGAFKVKLSGGDGGHNGVESIIYQLGTEDFARIRIGVGGPNFSQENIADYVLSDFSKSDQVLLQKVFENCSTLVESFILGGTKQMLDVNSKFIKSNSEEK